jgi:hypothetical protein
MNRWKCSINMHALTNSSMDEHSREMYDKWQAQKWWNDNNERIMELYNVRRQVLPTPSRTDDGEVSSYPLSE